GALRLGLGREELLPLWPGAEAHPRARPLSNCAQEAAEHPRVDPIVVAHIHPDKASLLELAIPLPPHPAAAPLPVRIEDHQLLRPELAVALGHLGVVLVRVLGRDHLDGEARYDPRLPHLPALDALAGR